MKKLILLFVGIFLAVLPGFGVSTSGEWIPLEGGMNFYPVRISLSVLDKDDVHKTVLNIKIVSNEAQQIKESNTKALIRLKDGTVLELDSYGEAGSLYDPQVHYGTVYPLYQSWQSYIIEDDDLSKILTQPIIKVRVEQRSGDRKDVEVSGKQGKKVLKKLNESWTFINQRQNQRIYNSESDIKEDF